MKDDEILQLDYRVEDHGSFKKRIVILDVNHVEAEIQGFHYAGKTYEASVRLQGGNFCILWDEKENFLKEIAKVIERFKV